MSSKNNEADISEVSINDDEASSNNNATISSKSDRSVSTKNIEADVSTKNDAVVSTKNADAAVSSKNVAVSTKNAAVSTKNAEAAVSTKNAAVSTKNAAVSSKSDAVSSKNNEADISHYVVGDVPEEKQSTKSDSKDDKDDKGDKDDDGKDEKDDKGDKDVEKIEAKTENLILQSAKSIRNWLFKAESKEVSTKVEVDVEGDVELGNIPTDYLFSLEVETKSGTALIYFQDGDDPLKLAKEFGAKHKFGKKLVKKLSIMIREKHLEYIKLSSVSEDGDDCSSPRSLKVTICDIVNQVNKPPAGKVRSPKASEIVSKLKEKSVLGGADMTAAMKKMKINEGLQGKEPTRFADWSRDDLISVLIDQNVELRGERKITVECLQHTCDIIFKDSEMPEKPPLVTDEMKEKQNKLVQFVQDKWIEVIAHKRTRRLENDILHAKFRSLNQYETVEYDITDSVVLPHRIGSDEEDIDTAVDSDQSVAWTTNPNNKKTKSQQQAIDFLETPWVPPDWAKAKEYIGYFHPRKGGKGGEEFSVCSGTTTGRHCCVAGLVVDACGSLENKCDIFGEGQLSDFAAYGSGITNYFKTLKWFIWIQFMMCCLGLPSLVLNIYANTYSEKGTMSTIGLSTCGNLGDVYADVSVDIAIPGCSELIENASCSLTREGLGIIYCWLDIVICIVLIVGIIWLRRAEKLEDKVLNENTLDVAMYTVQIKDLPEDTTKEGLKAHIDKVLGNPDENEIVEMEFAYAQEEEIIAFTERGDIHKQKSRAINLYRKNVTHIKEGVEEQEVKEKKIYEQRQYLALTLVSIDEKRVENDKKLTEIISKPLRLLSAFVTFDKISSANKFVSHYNLNLDQWQHYPEQLRLDGKIVMVRHAVDPSLLIWENLQYNIWQRSGSSFGTFIAAIILIAITVIVTFATKYLQQAAITSAGSLLCPSDFTDYTSEAKIAYIQADSGYLHCYCTELKWIDTFDNTYCKEYAYNQLKAGCLQYFSSIIVLVVNSLMEYTIQVMAEAEHHHSHDTKEMTIFFRVFLLRYVNMSCIFLINNVENILSSLSVTTDASSLEFSSNWYFTVGVTITLVQIGSVISSQVSNLMDMIFHRLKVDYAKVDSTACLTQDELNELRKGPPFLLSIRYATVLATFFVCFTFSTGMPILYYCAFFNMLVTYFMDKYMFVRVCQQPIHLSQDVGRVGTSVLYIALIIHMCSAFWTLSNSELFGGTTGSNKVSSLVISETMSSLSHSTVIYQKIVSGGGFPMFCFLFIVVGLRIILYIIYSSKYLVEKIQFCVEGDFLEKKMFSSLEAQENALKSITYTRALQRNLIKGLSSYNILANPIYKNKFGSSWDWATKHHNVRSLIKLKVAKDDSGDFHKEAIQAPRRLSLQQSERRLTIGDKRRVGQDTVGVNDEDEDVELGVASNDDGDLDAETILRIAASSSYGNKLDQKGNEAALLKANQTNPSINDDPKQFANVVATNDDKRNDKGIKRYADF